ncbi:hypothetical protein Ddc_15864 [Ditylenchus destructor]|nr:hypothetical protein Ddc_15864 [Ditylenchus destructor]
MKNEVDTTPKRSVKPKAFNTQITLQDIWMKNDETLRSEEPIVVITPETPKSRFTESFKRKFDTLDLDDEQNPSPFKRSFIQSNSVQEVDSNSIQEISNTRSNNIVENYQDAKLTKLKYEAKNLFEESDSNFGRLRKYIQNKIGNLKERGWIESFYDSDDSEPDDRDENTKRLQGEKDKMEDDIMNRILEILPEGFANGKHGVEFTIVHFATEDFEFLIDSEPTEYYVNKLKAEVNALKEFNELPLQKEVEQWFCQENDRSINESSANESATFENEEKSVKLEESEERNSKTPTQLELKEIPAVAKKDRL